MDEGGKIKPIYASAPFLWLSGNGSALNRCWLWALKQYCWPTSSLPAFPSSAGYLISFSWELAPCTKFWFARIAFAWRKEKTSLYKSPHNDGPKVETIPKDAALEVKEKAAIMFSVARQRGLQWLPFLQVSLWGEVGEKSQPVCTGWQSLPPPGETPSMSYKIWMSPVMFRPQPG